MTEFELWKRMKEKGIFVSCLGMLCSTCPRFECGDPIGVWGELDRKFRISSKLELI